MNVKTKNLPATKQNEQAIHIINNKEGELLVDARELHAKLGVKVRFADWIKRRIGEYGLTEGIDYLSVSQKRENGGRTIEYHVPIDVAKELAMVERTEAGRAIRRYFIEAEKELRTKRLYGQKLNLSELRRQVFTCRVNGRLMLAAREARALLGFNPRGSLSHWRAKYPGLIINYNGKLVATEEVVELWMLRATLHGKQQYALALSESQPVLGKNFGQLPLNFGV